MKITLKVLAFAVLLVGSQAFGMSVTTPDGTTYTVNTDTNTVTTNNNLIIPVGTEPMRITMTPDGAKLYVSNTGDNTVTPIDTATQIAGAPIAVVYRPTEISVSPGGRFVYVTGETGRTSVINVETDLVVETLEAPAPALPAAARSSAVTAPATIPEAKEEKKEIAPSTHYSSETVSQSPKTTRVGLD